MKDSEPPQNCRLKSQQKPQEKRQQNIEEERQQQIYIDEFNEDREKRNFRQIASVRKHFLKKVTSGCYFFWGRRLATTVVNIFTKIKSQAFLRCQVKFHLSGK